MGFDQKEFTKYFQEIQYLPHIYLPREEYALVMSEFNTHMSEVDRTHRIVTKPIGNFYYTIINNGFDDYIVIGKRPIDSEIEKLWEEE